MTASTDWQLMSPLLKKMNLKINRMPKKEKKKKKKESVISRKSNGIKLFCSINPKKYKKQYKFC